MYLDLNSPCRLLSICKIVSNWKYVSCIKNLPGHIYGTMEWINQIKQNYQNNDKTKLKRFSDKFNELSQSQVYMEFLKTDKDMKALKEFWNQADDVLESYYTYNITITDLFANIKTISEQVLSESEFLKSLSNYIISSKLN